MYSNYFDSTEDEILGLQKLVIETKKYLDREYQPDGYNVGINCGEVSGPTIVPSRYEIGPLFSNQSFTLSNSKRSVSSLFC